MVVGYLGVGSNLGNRRKFIRAAIAKINELPKTKVVKASKIIETKPVAGPAGQGKFLNIALKIKTGLKPIKLLKSLKKIEKELGRVKTVANGPRVIDLDILFYGDRTISTKVLKVPHPRVFEREFVIKPLLEII